MAEHIGTARRLITSALRGLRGGKTQEIGAAGITDDALKVITENGHLLEEILVELKINNAIGNEAFDLDFKEDDIIGK